MTEPVRRERRPRPRNKRLPAAILVALSVTALLAGTDPAPVAAAPSATLVTVETGFSHPVLVTHAGDGSGRLFVVEQGGLIKIIKNGNALGTPFLSLTNKISTGAERGLLGLAFHPAYETNRKLYVYYTRGDGDIVVDEYRADPGNPDRALSSSARRILRINHPLSNHNGGHLAFGRGGYLYIGTGDGGGSGDPNNNGQRRDTLLGKLLRIDINGTSGPRAYRVPSSNPLVGKPGRNEIWSWGLRNPWRWSFDRATGDLWIGDVGQSRWEEVDRSRLASGAGKGMNFGWRVMEGNHCYKPASGCNRAGKVKPLAEYSHTYGCSITGGYVYRGSQVASLRGYYVFGDYCSGRIWTLPHAASRPADERLLMNTGHTISSFGEDQAGELYLVDRGGGTIYRFAQVP
jgi:glucose/arabinose dehydrogenase